MQLTDSALEVRIVGRHVIRADQVIQTCARPSHSGYNVVTRLEFPDIGTYGFNATEAFVTGHEKIESRGRSAILSRINFFIGSIHSDAKYFHEYSPSVRD